MAVKVNTSGHFQNDTTVPGPLTAVAGAAISQFQACYIKAADGKIYPLDGTEAAANAYCGIADAAYSMGATATFYPPGTQLTGLSGLTVGDLYGKQDGTIVAYSGVGSAQWTRRVCIATSTTAITVDAGEVVQHP